MRAGGPGQSPQLLLDLLALLARNRIPHAVIGALAVSFHGLPRSTDDADAVVWLGGTSLTGDDLLRRLHEAGFGADYRRGDPDDPILGVISVRDPHGNRADLLLGIRGMDPDAAGRSLEARLLGVPVRFAGAEDLVAMKIFAGGPQDLQDVRGILQVSKGTVDRALLERLVRRYGTKEADTLAQLLMEAGI